MSKWGGRSKPLTMVIMMALKTMTTMMMILATFCPFTSAGEKESVKFETPFPHLSSTKMAFLHFFYEERQIKLGQHSN